MSSLPRKIQLRLLKKMGVTINGKKATVKGAGGRVFTLRHPVLGSLETFHVTKGWRVPKRKLIQAAKRRNASVTI